MKNKLWFLVKMSLNKKIKTKWFLIANIIFMILIVGLINIDTIIKFFGGDFDDTAKIMVIDNASVYNDFKDNYTVASKYLSEFDNTEITLYEKSYDEGLEEIKKDDNILLVIDRDNENYIRAKIVSNDELGTITSTLVRTVLTAVRSKIVLDEYNITNEMYQNINKNVDIESVILNDDNVENGFMISSVMQVLTLPIFMLIIFLVQMIGAEVNEEKTTKSMEIIISNVSPKTHFMSKVISSNVFVIIQGLLLLVYIFIGAMIRYFVYDGNLLGGVGGELSSILGDINLEQITSTIGIMIPVLLVIFILTFVAYSLLAGILASMTTNLEDYQHLQTPIVIISLLGYYLSTMAGIFKGSIFIRIMCYVPFISSLLAPTMYVMGEITIFDLLGSILLLVGTIYLLVKYGLRVYKVGILNYSGSGLWKKMFMAIRK